MLVHHKFVRIAHRAMEIKMLNLKVKVKVTVLAERGLGT